MKRYFVIVVLFFVSGFSYAQQDTSAVLKVVIEMRVSLVQKQEAVLEKLLHPAITFGHSSGWVQGRTDVFRDMKSGFLVYKAYDAQSTEITINGKYATVKERVAVEGNRNGTDFKMNLFVLQLWVKEKKGWKLLQRQSAKI